VEKNKYTFLLPAYRGRYLYDALSSIINQTFLSFQIIVSDDASPELLQEIVKTCNDSRISYRRNSTNLGADRLVDHWNMLLQRCESEYVIIASDDDLYHPSFLETIDTLTKQHPEADILRASACIIDQDGVVTKTENNYPDWLSMSDFLRHLLMPESVLCIGNYVFRTAALKAAGGFVPFRLGWKSDSATQILLSRNGVPCTKDVLFSFRMSGLNISSHQARDRERDRAKLCALIDFDAWMTNNVEQAALEQYRSAFRNRLEGESRSYLWTLSFTEFRRLFEIFKKEQWFRSIRSQLSFILCWVRVHYA
jgi:glycosyltransferase involved in cell wall biosynthesis